MRFHLGDGKAADGRQVLTPASLQAMRSNPGPAGTITMELDGVCVGFWQRRTAEGVPVYQHGGSWGGQNSDFFFVPDRQFAMTVLTNSTSGGRLLYELGRVRLGLEPVLRLEQSAGRPAGRSRRNDWRATKAATPPG